VCRWWFSDAALTEVAEMTERADARAAEEAETERALARLADPGADDNTGPKTGDR